MKIITNTITLFFVLFSLAAVSQNGSCLSFDGNDDYLTTQNLALNGIGTQDFTFEAWVNGVEASQPSHPTIFSNRRNTSTGTIFFFHNRWGGSLYKMLAVQLNGANYFILNNGTFNGSVLDGNCHHVAITRLGELLTFYIDGTPIGTRIIYNGNPSVSSNNQLFIGREPLTGNYFDGTLSQIRIWDYARNQTEIMNDHSVSLIPAITGLKSYWEMSDGSGEVVIDKTGLDNAQRGSSNASDNNDPQWGTNCCIDSIPTPTNEGAYCCEGENLVDNGNFENGLNGITTTYSQTSVTYPGEYDVVTAASNFNASITDHSFCEDPTLYPTNDSFMVVNGKTQQPVGTTSVIWEQTINIQPEKNYKLCANFKNMPQYTFDILPEVRLEINGVLYPWTTINTDATNPCDWQKISECFLGEEDQATIRIHLKEDGNGDGNDVAIDDISVQQKLDQNLSITVQNQGNPQQTIASINTINTSDDNTLINQDCIEQNNGNEYYWFVYELASYPFNAPIDFINMASNSFSWSSNLGGYSTQLPMTSNPIWNLTTTFPNYTFENNKLYVIGMYVPSCCESCYDEGWTYQLTLNGARTSSNFDTVFTTEVKDYLKSMFREFDQSILATDVLGTESFRIYPNPTNDILNIKTKKDIKSYKIYDLLGKLVVRKTLSFNETEIDVSKLQNNMYFITFETESGKKETFKFLKE